METCLSFNNAQEKEIMSKYCFSNAKNNAFIWERLQKFIPHFTPHSIWNYLRLTDSLW